MKATKNQITASRHKKFFASFDTGEFGISRNNIGTAGEHVAITMWNNEGIRQSDASIRITFTKEQWEFMSAFFNKVDDNKHIGSQSKF